MKAWAVRSHALNPGTGPRSVCINQPEWYIKFYITILIRRRLGLWRTGASGPSKPGWSHQAQDVHGHPPGIGQRPRTDRRCGPSGAQAEDPLARRQHAFGSVAPEVYATTGSLGVETESAPDLISWRAGAQRQAARSGGAARGVARALTGGPGIGALRVRAELRLTSPGTAEQGQAAYAGVRSQPRALPEFLR